CDGEPVLDVPGAHGCRDLDPGLERRRDLAPAVLAAVVVQQDDDAVVDPLLELPDKQLVRAGEGGPHDATNVVASDVLAHAVEVEALRPGAAPRRPKGWLLESTRQRPVEQRLRRGVHDDL